MRLMYTQARAKVSPRNSPISTVLTVESFLEVILSIYLFKSVDFLFENGIVESKTCKQYGRHDSGQRHPF